MKEITIIGPGRVGGALAIALGESGLGVNRLVYKGARPPSDLIKRLHAVEAISFSEYQSNSDEIVVLAVRDSEITSVAADLSGVTRPGTVVLHTSGTMSSKELGQLADAGCQVGSMHPLIAISDPGMGARMFKGAFFCVEGDYDAVEVAEKIVGGLGGRAIVIPRESKALYHASAVMAAGHVVALIDAACELMTLSGIDKETAKDMLLSLAKGAMGNLSQDPIEEAITGPYLRLDDITMEKHLAAFDEKVPPEIVEIYLSLALRSLDIAERKGLSADQIEQMRERINLARNKERMIL